MLFERFPRIELRYNIHSALVGMAITACCATFYGAIYEGIRGTEYFSQRINPMLAGIFSYFCAGCFLVLLYLLIRANPLKPVIIIDRDGFRDSRFTREMIHWDYVDAVYLRASPTGRGSNIVEIVLCDTVPPTIRAQVEGKKWWNYRKDGLVVTIYPEELKGMSAERIARSLVIYQNQFGTHKTVQ